MSSDERDPLKIPAKVLGCLRSGFVTIIVGHDFGQLDGGIPTEISIGLLPFDLRTPNKEFIALLDRASGVIFAIERIDPP